MPKCYSAFFLTLLACYSHCRDQVQYEGMGSINIQIPPTLLQKSTQLEQYNNIFLVQSQYQEPLSSFSFEFEHDTQEFYLHTPVATRLTFLIRVLSINNGAYEEISDINQETPVSVQVYINNNQVLHSCILYFYTGFAVQSGKDSNLMIRFSSPSRSRSVTIEHTKIMQSAPFETKLTSKSNEENSIRLQQIRNTISRVEGQLKRNHRLAGHSQALLLEGIDRFSVYSLSETFIALGICLLQVQLIKNLSRPKTII